MKIFAIILILFSIINLILVIKTDINVYDVPKQFNRDTVLKLCLGYIICHGIIGLFCGLYILFI